jgi:hypothetical protein
VSFFSIFSASEFANKGKYSKVLTLRYGQKNRAKFCGKAAGNQQHIIRLRALPALNGNLCQSNIVFWVHQYPR